MPYYKVNETYTEATDEQEAIRNVNHPGACIVGEVSAEEYEQNK